MKKPTNLVEHQAEKALKAAGWFKDPQTLKWSPGPDGKVPEVKTQIVSAKVLELMGKYAKSWGVLVDEMPDHLKGL